MKPLRLLSATLSISAALLVLQGCVSAIENRIQEKPTVFGQLPPEVQQHIRQGEIEVGYTKDMVYFALGKASKVQSKQTPDGMQETWIYKNMSLPTTGGFRGLSYNTGMSITPGQGASAGTHTAKSATQTDNNINQGQLDAATELPDLPMGTLYVFFFGDRVYKMAMEQ